MIQMNNTEFRKYMMSREQEFKIIPDVADYTEEQFAEVRYDYLGASDSAALLNASPFGDTFDTLFEEKMNRVSDPTIGRKPNVRMGKELEPFIIQKFNEITGFNAIKPRDMFIKEGSMLAVNFDGIMVYEHDILPVEVKTVSKYGKKYYDFSRAMFLEPYHPLSENMEFTPELIASAFRTGFELATNQKTILEDTLLITDPSVQVGAMIPYRTQLASTAFGIPPYYYTQIQQQMMFLNSDFGILLVLDVDLWCLSLFHIPRDEAVMEAIKTAASAFESKRTIETLLK